MRIPIVALSMLVAFLAVPATNAGTALVSGTPVVAMAQESQQPAPAESQPSQPSQPSSQPAPSSQSPSQSSSPQVNVTVDQPDRVWYANPTWIAIGTIAAGLLVVIIVMAARGGSGGPTVVRGA